MSYSKSHNYTVLTIKIMARQIRDLYKNKEDRSLSSNISGMVYYYKLMNTPTKKTLNLCVVSCHLDMKLKLVLNIFLENSLLELSGKYHENYIQTAIISYTNELFYITGIQRNT